MSAYTYDENIFSDLYKDVYGSRPRGHEFYEAFPDRKQEIWDRLLDAHEWEMEESRKREAAAVAQFRETLQKIIATGASDEATAIRWLLDGQEFTLYDYQYGADYISYFFGLPYSNEWCDQFDEITQERVKELYAEEFE